MATDRRYQKKSARKPHPNISRGRLTRDAHYRSIDVDGYRGVTGVALRDLGRVNILVGDNNTGKTSLLESLYIHACGFNLQPAIVAFALRRTEGNAHSLLDFAEKVDTAFDAAREEREFTLRAYFTNISSSVTIFSRLNGSSILQELYPEKYSADIGLHHTSEPPSMPDALESGNIGASDVPLAGEDNEERERGVIGNWTTMIEGDPFSQPLRYPPSAFKLRAPLKLAKWQDAFTHRNQGSGIRIFSHLKRNGALEQFASDLSQGFPAVQKIDNFPYANGTVGPVYIYEKDSGRKPLYVYGDGFRRWFDLLGNMVAFRKALHCVDEIDASFHPGAQPQVSRQLVRYALQYDNQLVMTTHNLEFTDNFLEAMYGEGGELQGVADDPVMIYRLKCDDSGKVDVWPIKGSEAHQKRDRFGLELR